MRPSPLAWIYLAVGAGIVVAAISLQASGWEPAAPERLAIPADVRQSPGGYRSFHFWHYGLHGGK